MDDKKHIEILYPAGTITVMTLTYVHRVGFSVRSVGVPGSDPESYNRTIERVMGYTPQLPIIFMFTGIWADKGKIYTYVTGDAKDATAIVVDPTLLRTMGEQMDARLVPLDPITGSGELSIIEHNDWISQHVPGAERSTTDWDALTDVSDVSDIESFLSEIAGKSDSDSRNLGGAFRHLYTDNNKEEEEG